MGSLKPGADCIAGKDQAYCQVHRDLAKKLQTETDQAMLDEFIQLLHFHITVFVNSDLASLSLCDNFSLYGYSVGEQLSSMCILKHSMYHVQVACCCIHAVTTVTLVMTCNT